MHDYFQNSTNNQIMFKFEEKVLYVHEAYFIFYYFFYADMFIVVIQNNYSNLFYNSYMTLDLLMYMRELRGYQDMDIEKVTIKKNKKKIKN